MKAVIWMTDWGVKNFAEGRDVSADNFTCMSPDTDMTDLGYVRIVELDIPNGNLPTRSQAITMALARLKETEVRVRADFERKLLEIETVRRKMLAIENVP